MKKIELSFEIHITLEVKTMRRCCFICLSVLLIGLTRVASGWAAPRVAVMDFENRSQYGEGRLGSGAADILTTELVKTGKLDMFERDRLNAVLKEQKMGASGLVDPATAAQIGKLIGVNYIITGAVTEYGRSRAGGGGGGVNVGQVGYHSAVDIRMVDATSGKIVFADSASDSVSSFSVSAFGFGGGEEFNEKNATEAMRGAIQKVAAKIESTPLSSSSTGQAVVGTGKAVVADVDGNSVSLNKGTEIDLQIGQTVTICRQGKVIKDPSTGKILKIKYETVGEIKLKTVEQGYSEGTVVSGSGFTVGDIVR